MMVTAHEMRFHDLLTDFLFILFPSLLVLKKNNQDVLPNIDVSDVMDIPKVFQCDEQTLPCDHTTKYRTLTGWCNNLNFPEYGKSIRAFTRLLAPAYDDGLMSPRSTSVTGKDLPSPRRVQRSAN